MLTRALRRGVKSLIPTGLVTYTLGAPVGSRILLTFDDGPNRAVTPQVLERLDRHGARAVFFVVGRCIERAPELLPEIVRHGHVLGNHTYQHRRGGDPWLFAYYQDLRQCQALIAAHAPPPRLFRPPSGHLSFTSLTTSWLLGLRMIHWSLNVRDWKCHTQQEALTAAEALVERAAPGHIVLLHDDNPYVLDLLDYVLPRLTDRGFDLGSAVDEFRAA